MYADYTTNVLRTCPKLTKTITTTPRILPNALRIITSYAVSAKTAVRTTRTYHDATTIAIRFGIKQYKYRLSASQR